MRKHQNKIFTVIFVFVGIFLSGCQHERGPAIPPNRNLFRIGSSLNLPPRNKENARFWNAMDYCRFEHEVRSFDLALLHSYPHYDAGQKKIIEVMDQIVAGQKEKAKERLSALQKDHECFIYCDIIDYLWDGVDSVKMSIGNNKYFGMKGRALKKVLEKRKIIFHKPKARVKTDSFWAFGRPIITVKIGKHTISMLMDTGAPFSVMSRSTAEELKAHLCSPLKNSVHESPHEPLISKFKVGDLKSVDKLKIGDLSITYQPFVIVDQNKNILGWDILKEMNIEVKNKTVFFSRSKLKKGNYSRNLFDFGSRFLVRADLPSSDDHLHFILDTGANVTILNTNIFRRDKKRPLLVPLKGALAYTFYGLRNYTYKAYPHFECNIVGESVIFFDVITYDLLGHPYGSIGMDCSKMEIDTPNGIFRITQNKKTNYDYSPILIDNVNPFVRYPAIIGVVIMLPTAILGGVCTIPFGKNKMIDYLCNFGEIMLGGPFWLLTSWAYRTRISPLEDIYREDLGHYAECLLVKNFNFHDNEVEALRCLQDCNDKWAYTKGAIYYGIGNYQKAIDCFENSSSTIALLYPLALIKSGRGKDAKNLVDRYLKMIAPKLKLLPPKNILLTEYYLKPLVGKGTTNWKNSLEYSKTPGKMTLSYFLAEYYLTIKNDSDKAVEILRNALKHPSTDSLSCYLAHKMLNSIGSDIVKADGR